MIFFPPVDGLRRRVDGSQHRASVSRLLRDDDLRRTGLENLQLLHYNLLMYISPGKRTTCTVMNLEHCSDTNASNTATKFVRSLGSNLRLTSPAASTCTSRGSSSFATSLTVPSCEMSVVCRKKLRVRLACQVGCNSAQ